MRVVLEVAFVLGSSVFLGAAFLGGAFFGAAFLAATGLAGEEALARRVPTMVPTVWWTCWREEFGHRTPSNVPTARPPDIAHTSSRLLIRQHPSPVVPIVHKFYEDHSHTQQQPPTPRSSSNILPIMSRPRRRRQSLSDYPHRPPRVGAAYQVKISDETALANRPVPVRWSPEIPYRTVEEVERGVDCSSGT